MADKIVVLQAGRVEQVGSPLELYNAPANIFVAGFIGSPRMNFVTGADADKLNAKTIGVRPEHIDLSKDAGHWKGTVTVSEHLGSDTFLHVAVEGQDTMTVRADGDVAARYGDTVYLTPQADRIHRFGADGKTLK